MARGSSGRIVIEVSPELKARLYLGLEHEGKTLKEWFIQNAERFVTDIFQPHLFRPPPRNQRLRVAEEPPNATPEDS
jgi:hypothetical protein